MTGREHRIEHDREALADIARQLAVVLHRLQRCGVAIQADMADARGRNQIEHAVEQAVARAQDRDQAQFLRRQHGRLDRRERRFDRLGFERQIACDLVREQRADLAQQAAEIRRRGFLAPHQGQLVLHQRVVDDYGLGHGLSPFSVTADSGTPGKLCGNPCTRR